LLRGLIFKRIADLERLGQAFVHARASKGEMVQRRNMAVAKAQTGEFPGGNLVILCVIWIEHRPLYE
jgi:hypothetical protein